MIQIVGIPIYGFPSPIVDEKKITSQPPLSFSKLHQAINNQTQLLGKKLHKNRTPYYLYAYVDGISCAYSLFKYVLDLFLNARGDMMYHILMTPGGIAGFSAEAILLMLIAVLACHYDNDEAKKQRIKRMIANLWPYLRDAMKSLKNAYKGWRSFISILNVLAHVNAQYLIFPLGIVLGVLSVANRYFLRGLVTEPRKNKMDEVKALLERLHKATCTPFVDSVKARGTLESLKKDKIRRFYGAALIASILAGILDGFYLYAGVIALANLTSPLFIVMSTVCFLYILGCIFTRIYEEYMFQQRLDIGIIKCELLLLSKELKAEYHQEQNANKELNDLLVKFKKQQALLSQKLKQGYGMAVLFGLKNGLYLYGVTASALYF